MSALLSYFIHCCLQNMGEIKKPDRSIEQYRIFIILPVIALKLVCLKLEMARRWSDESKRSSHNYIGVGNLFISYAMYMMYLMNYDDGDEIVHFPAFHHFYMSENVSSPLWDEKDIENIWHFVLLPELTNGDLSSVEQVQSVVRRLVLLYTKHVQKLVLVIHPNCPKFLEPYDDITVANKITLDGFFVTQGQAAELLTLHDAVKGNDVTSFISRIGFAAIFTPTLRTFKVDGQGVSDELLMWMSRFVSEEQERISNYLLTNKILTRFDNMSITLAAKCIYLMCNMRKSDLIRVNILEGEQVFEDALDIPSRRIRCNELLEPLPLVSVWKAALQLSKYGIAAKVVPVVFKNNTVRDDCVEHLFRLNSSADGLKMYPIYISLRTGKPLESLEQVLLG